MYFFSVNSSKFVVQYTNRPIATIGKYHGLYKRRMYNLPDLPETFVAGFHDENAVRRMKYNTLGQTGLKVSQLSLGTGSFSHLYGNYDEVEVIKTVHEAIRNGINYIDTGYWYGQGTSETILGKALKDIPRQAYYIGTKCGRYELEPKLMFDFSMQKTTQNFNDALKRLQLDYVDVIQVHDVEFAPTLDQVLNETLPTLETFVQSGQAKYIGITGYPVSTLKECIEKSHTRISTILSYTRLTLIDQTLREYIPFCQNRGIGVINASGPSMGLLTNRGPQMWHPAHEETKRICREVGDYCTKKGVELGRLAVDYCNKQEGVATNLIGMNTRKLLQMNLDLLYNGLTEVEKTVLGEIQEKFLSKIQNTHWENVELEEYKKKIDPQ